MPPDATACEASSRELAGRSPSALLAQRAALA
jgi:hypothetical protein